MRQRSLPAFPSGYSDPRFHIGVDGRLQAMLSTFDLTSAQAQMDHQLGAAQPTIPPDARSVVLVLDEVGWREVANFARRSYYYDFDVAEDNWCIVAEPRCRPGDRNATAFVNGVVTSRYCIGDGIQHLQCDIENGFWVGYFDEGVFGNFGWGSGRGGPEPIGACGLRRFTRDGETALKYPNEVGDIADCYAMNVIQDVAWISARTQIFRLCRCLPMAIAKNGSIPAFVAQLPWQ